MSTLKVDTVRPVTTDASLTLQGDSSGAGVTGAKVFGDGSLGADSITNLAGTGAPDFTNGWKSEGMDAYACRAWVNFNGTGTVAIRESGNVSSITDIGTGSYTVNFTTAMPDANYASTFSGSRSTSPGATALCNVTSLTTSNFKVYITTDAGNLADGEQVHLSTFR